MEPVSSPTQYHDLVPCSQIPLLFCVDPKQETYKEFVCARCAHVCYPKVTDIWVKADDVVLAGLAKMATHCHCAKFNDNCRFSKIIPSPGFQTDIIFKPLQMMEEIFCMVYQPNVLSEFKCFNVKYVNVINCTKLNGFVAISSDKDLELEQLQKINNSDNEALRLGNWNQTDYEKKYTDTVYISCNVAETNQQVNCLVGRFLYIKFMQLNGIDANGFLKNIKFKGYNIEEEMIENIRQAHATPELLKSLKKIIAESKPRNENYVYCYEKLQEFVNKTDLSENITTFTLFNELFKEIKITVLSFLNPKEKFMASLVCKEWSNLIVSNFQIDILSWCISGLRYNCKANKNYCKFAVSCSSGKNTLSRLNYLVETLETIEKMSSDEFITIAKEHQDNRGLVKCLIKILDSLNEQLLDLATFLKNVIKGTQTITENFDIFELTLRRYYDQITKMYLSPAKKNPIVLSHPELLIEDPSTRRLWVDIFGVDCFNVTYKQFERKVLLKIIKDYYELKDKHDKKLIAKAIQFFIHFPKNNLITPYSLYLLNSHWGSLEDMIPNIEHYALREGFMGLINNIRAEELLKDELNVKKAKVILLLRFSRMCPDLLTLSIGTSKYMSHVRKPSNVSIKEFLSWKQNYSKNGVFASYRINWDIVEDTMTVAGYAYSDDGLYLEHCNPKYFQII